MSGQVSDGLIYKEKLFSIVSASPLIGFHPGQFNLMPIMESTACVCGYWVDYKLENEVLFADTLYINTFQNKYPDINGISVSYEKCKNMGHHFYKNLNIKQDYTGKLLIGADFIIDYYVHSGYQSAWGYKTLYEIELVNGRAVFEKDLSDFVRKTREKLGDEHIVSINIDGEYIDFVKTAEINYKDSLYVILDPALPLDGFDDDSSFIFKAVKNENGYYQYEAVADPTVIEGVSKQYYIDHKPTNDEI